MVAYALKTYDSPFPTIRSYLMNPFLIAAISGTVLGTINYLYFRTKGYTSYGQLYLSVIAFFALTLLVLKLFR